MDVIAHILSDTFGVSGASNHSSDQIMIYLPRFSNTQQSKATNTIQMNI
jgi:hypothetical protein